MVDLSKEFGFGFFNSFGELISKLVPIVFDLVAVVIVFYFLYAGFRFIISGGDKNAVAEARGMITHAIIGLLMLIILFLFLQVLPKWLGLEGFQIIGGP